MEPVAFVLGIEVTRRDARSALPDAPVRPPSGRWSRLVRFFRRGPATGR